MGERPGTIFFLLSREGEADDTSFFHCSLFFPIFIFTLFSLSTALDIPFVADASKEKSSCRTKPRNLVATGPEAFTIKIVRISRKRERKRGGWKVGNRMSE